MEQLAHFVTKSFEYNNNRVLDVLNMATKSLICENFKPSDEAISNTDDTDLEDGSDSIDIDITDMSSNDGTENIKFFDKNDTNKVINSNVNSIKKSNKENLGQVMKNWLISDYPQKENNCGS